MKKTYFEIFQKSLRELREEFAARGETPPEILDFKLEPFFFVENAPPTLNRTRYERKKKRSH